MLHNTFWILKQRPGRSLAVVVSTQVVQSIQQPHYQFVQRGGQKQYSMYFSQVVGWQVVSREAAPFPETSWHSSWRARGQPGQQIQTNQLRNTNVQINANESIQNVDFNFLPSVLGDCCEPIASWVNTEHFTHKMSGVCGWILQALAWNGLDAFGSIVMMACSITQYVYNMGATTSRYHVSFVHKGTSTSWKIKSIYFYSVQNNRCLGTASHSARARRWIESIHQTTEFPTALLGLSSLPLMQLHLRRFTYCKPWNTQGRCAASNTINI